MFSRLGMCFLLFISIYWIPICGYGKNNQNKDALEEEKIKKATYLYKQGADFYMKGKNDSALAAFNKSLKISEQLSQKENDLVAANLNSLGVIYSSLYKYKEAKDVIEKSLAINEKKNNKNHSSISTHEKVIRNFSPTPANTSCTRVLSFS